MSVPFFRKPRSVVPVRNSEAAKIGPSNNELRAVGRIEVGSSSKNPTRRASL